MPSRRITVGVIAAACLLAAGCSAKDPAAGSSGKATGSVVAAASAGSTDPSPSPPAPSSAAPAQPAEATGPCSLLTKPQAAQVLGGAVIKTMPGAANAGAGMKKIDGCYYKAAKTSVSDAVVDLGPISPSEAIAAARARMPRDSALRPFEPGLGGQSLGVTGALGTGFIAIVHIATGHRLSSVTAAAKSAAEAKRIALDTATILIGG